MKHPLAYRPRRATARWQEEAPDFVLDVFDNPQCTDRYDVYFGGPLLDPALLRNRKVHGLALSENAGSGRGVCYWFEVEASYRPSHRRIRWLDLPAEIRRIVVNEAEAAIAMIREEQAA